MAEENWVKKNKTLVFIVVAVLIVIGAYFLFTNSGSKQQVYVCPDGSQVRNPNNCFLSTDYPSAEDCSSLLAAAKAKNYNVSFAEKVKIVLTCNQEEMAGKNLTPTNTNPISLSGSGNQVTEKFYLKQGLVIFRNSYQGESNFIAYLIDENGDKVDLVANTIGTSETSSSAKITREGYYRLEVTAWSGSSWTINIEQ